jgi:hypothetical protein
MTTITAAQNTTTDQVTTDPIDINLVFTDGQWEVSSAGITVQAPYRGRIRWHLPANTIQVIKFRNAPAGVIFRTTATSPLEPSWDLDPLLENSGHTYSVAWINDIPQNTAAVTYTYNIQLELIIDPTVQNDPPPPTGP